MKADDISSAMELSSVANWNQTGEDWRRTLHLSPDDCRCIEDGGKLAATATLLPYGTRLAWIGMVLTRPEYRRQGLARQMMEDAISRAEQRDIRTLKLDATEEGRALYESVGFVVENKAERWGYGGIEFRRKTPADRAVEGTIDGTGISDDCAQWMQKPLALGAWNC
jgi:predicted GNAT family N-acyltransferase